MFLILGFVSLQLLDENRWYSFDDNHISAMGEEEVKTNAAYVLFYRRKKYDDFESKCIP